jgi:ribosomal protein L25, Ctc-form
MATSRQKLEITAQSRSEEGRGASRRIRRAGGVPGVVYGGDAEPMPITLDHNELYHSLRKEAFHSSILTITLDKKPMQALLRDFQMHPYKQQVLHVDFMRVDPKRRITMRVPLHFINGELSPAVKLEGALINQIMNELEVSCLPKDLPEYIDIDLSEMTVGAAIHVSSLKLPAGVTAVVPHGLDPTIVTASVVKEEVITEEEVPEEAAPVAAPAEEGKEEE